MKKIETYQNEFIEFKNELNSYIYRLVSNTQDAEDISQESYYKAFKNIESFKEKSTFKTWVFSIATNLSKDKIKERKRWQEDWMDHARDAHVENPTLMQRKFEISNNSEFGKFEITEHINFCFNCINKTLLITNQICLLLKEVYQFKISEIMIITNLTEGKVKHAIADARKDMNRIFKKRCALINKNGVCHQCTGLNKAFNPEQDEQIKLNNIKMVVQANKENYDELFNLRLQLVESIDPLNAKGKNLHNYLMENMPKWAELQLKNIEKGSCKSD